MAVEKILAEIAAERAAQDAKWGEQNHPDGTDPKVWSRPARTYRETCQLAAKSGMLTWRHVLIEEVAEAFAESDSGKLRAELIQVAAVAAAWVEAIDRRNARTAEPPAEGHGYTKHGHPCCGYAILGDKPAAVAQCGGAGLCKACSAGVARIHLSEAL